MADYDDIILSNKLPYDILELVFTFLSLEDQVSCCLVSKQWFTFIMELADFSKSCSEKLPSLVNNRKAIRELLHRLITVDTLGDGLFVIPGTPPSTMDTLKELAAHPAKGCYIEPMDAVNFLDMILIKNDFQIERLCFRDWLQTDRYDFQRNYTSIKKMVCHDQILTYSVEATTMKTSEAWYEWTTGYNWEDWDYVSTKKVVAITIDNNEEMRQQYKDNGGLFFIDDSFPRKEPEITIVLYEKIKSLTYFKISSPTISVPSTSRMYPDHGAFGIIRSLCYLYLDALNHKNPLISARVASDNMPDLRTICISPLAELPKEIRYNDRNNLSNFYVSRDNDDSGDLRCLIWTMGNSLPADRNTFEWHCRVNRCRCFTKNMYRILSKQYHHLELLYLQYDGAHGIAFRSMRFLSLPTTLEVTHLRELHLHATSSTLFGHFCSTSIKDRTIYGTVDDMNQYLAQAVSRMPALEIIVLENDYVDYDKLLLHDMSAYSSVVYMTVNDEVLLSLASHCTQLKEVVIWGPHMEITGSGVLEFASTTVANLGSLTLLEVDCLLSDNQVTALLHSDSLKNLRALKSKDRPILCP
ncbi:hypothetical protein BDA99DRAFT_525029 [Phascolomyces articulosus]|uniref:F-box domain-containing protein n=1 Tax=Phascolomyces articulosus TaxID=60185 RepID=A0AAD5JQ51_9FUNG|nr:hypothetical protein BDA99DRAFT_525029 [Phascolomyces articulosus]